MDFSSDRWKKEAGRVALWAALIIVIIWIGSNLPNSSPQGRKASINSNTTETTGSTQTPAPKKKKAEVLADILNLRAEPNTSAAAVIGVLKKGAVVEVLGEEESWLQVKTDDGQTGYVAGDSNLIKLLDE